MNIKLYYTKDDNNQLSKSLTLVYDLTGNLRNESDIVHPVILIEAATLGNSNYAYIAEFDRYYFIREVKSVRTGLWLVTFESDPLMSFKDSIRALYVVLQETEVSSVNNYLPDERVWLSTVKDKTSIITFPYGLLDTGEYILITAGG